MLKMKKPNKTVFSLLPDQALKQEPDAESRDIKSLTRFPGNPILEILIKKILLRR